MGIYHSIFKANNIHLLIFFAKNQKIDISYRLSLCGNIVAVSTTPISKNHLKRIKHETHKFIRIESPTTTTTTTPTTKRFKNN
jgi:hypothetical protein